MSQQILVIDVIFREDLYPRIETDPSTVQKYADTLDVLPPIEVNQHNELIDGWHRWTAHKKVKAEEIAVVVTETQSDAHLLALAIERNAKFGLQLTQADKQEMARKIYHTTADKDREDKKKYLADILSVSERTIRSWLSRIDKDSKEARNKRIFDLWMACYTQEEIAEREGVKQQAIDQILQKMAGLPNLVKSDQAKAEFADDFDIPIYNIWKFKKKSNKSGHYGNTEQVILDNLLYLYTQPFDVVVDPFAGGGSTIDICKKRFRRRFISDRLPIPEREKEIRQHDITEGLPPLPRWKDIKLVYLDPPYWKQAEGEYSDNPEDLANMSLENFTKTLSELINKIGKKLVSTSHIALIMQPTQWRAPDRQYTDHIADMLRLVKLPIEMRISCPYESQQCSAQMVEWSKETKSLLVLSREVIVWSI